MDTTDTRAMKITAALSTLSLPLLTLCQKMATISLTLVPTVMVLFHPLWSSVSRLSVNGWLIRETAYLARSVNFSASLALFEYPYAELFLLWG